MRAFSLLLLLGSTFVPVPAAGGPDLVSDASQYDGQPALAVDAAGAPWVAWVGFAKDKGDQVFCARRADSGWSRPVAVTTKPGNYVRPAIACSGETAHVFWTATTEEKTSIWMSRCAAGKWSEPARVSPADGYHQNPEACVDPQGRVWLTWQGFVRGNYDIFLASFDGARWSDPATVTADPGNDWDPAIVCDSTGKITVAWCSFREADYDLYLASYADGKLSGETRLSDHGGYDLHPWLAVDAKDRVWCAWDRIAMPYHGDSGGTMEDRDRSGERKERPKAEIVLRCFDGSKLLRPVRALPDLPKGYTLQHCGYPKIAVDRAGTVLLFHRALMHEAGGKPRERRGTGYWWDVIATRLDGDRWSAPLVLEKSDGYLEEPAVGLGADSVWIAYQMEHRGLPDDDDDGDHHVGMRPLGENGDIYVTKLAAGRAAEPALEAAPALSKEPSALSRRFVPRSAAKYEIEYGGTKYAALFGDLHKHSNISRCSSGTEPSLDDHYRYSHDVCRYDFMMMSDHSQHTTDFNWWKLQKSADLYYIPDYFVTLFGYEASNRHPIGHRNIVFPARPAPIIRSTLDGGRTGREIWKALDGVRAITIPHTSADPGMGTDWREHDPKFERLVEIFQACRGSYESDGCPRQHSKATAKGGFVQDALAKGYKLGIISSTDHGYGVSYAIVYAKSATREDVFDALYNRRCYASTAYGIVLDFRADGHLMGEEIATDKDVALSVFARGYAKIRSVEIIRDGKVAHSWKPERAEAKLECRDDAAKGAHYYYARVILEDGEIAWSSPVWVDVK
ncbi:MAG: hypothetical protein HYY17_14890 [Planctomycetes bacterium]|nr:hypothetical protein [Planctomycetota bacterium]